MTQETQNMQNIQLTEFLVFLEEHGVTDEQILEKMEIVQSTLNRWWKRNSCNARHLAKLRIWCATFVPITETYYGDRPPEYLYRQALDCADDSYSKERFNMEWKGYYQTGIPAGNGSRQIRGCRWRSWYRKPRPTNEFVIETLAKWHPEESVRLCYQKLIANAENAE